MYLIKFIKNKFIKKFFAIFIVLSSILTPKNTNSFITIKNLIAGLEITKTNISFHIDLPKNFKKIIFASAVTACSSYICLKAYIAYKNGIKQYKILKEFQKNKNYTYENLKIDACQLYYEQCSNPSALSIYSDYPIMWILEQATKNSKTLSWFFFIQKLNNLSKKLNEKLTFLINHIEFKKEKKEYSDKYRRQDYK